jgi:acyl-CoA dehydrogenase
MGTVDFELTEDQQTIRKAVAELSAKFDDQYWMEKDLAHEFPTEYYHPRGVRRPRIRHH